jgi:hypothetical protein
MIASFKIFEVKNDFSNIFLNDIFQKLGPFLSGGIFLHQQKHIINMVVPIFAGQEISKYLSFVCHVQSIKSNLCDRDNTDVGKH